MYPAGTEYAVCQAEAQILGAVVCIMNESLTDAIRGFYKLRKALSILETVAAHEKQYLERHGQANAAEAVNGTLSAAESEEAAASINEKSNPASFSSPIDQFIQSTTSSQYGILLTILSLIPPAFSRLLSIVGFGGDLERGMSLLWRASSHHDINGSVAALVILGFSNGLMCFLDIKPPHYYPASRLRNLLQRMRARYPRSELWRLEESRMHAADTRVEQAVTLLGMHAGPLGEASDEANAKSGATERKAMKQVQALQTFERGVGFLCLHAYAQAARAFERSVELNNWSHALYYYIAGCTHVELYRVHKHGGILPLFHKASDPEDLDSIPETTAQIVAPDENAAKHHAAEAKRLLDKVPGLAGKRRMFARTLPFDVFVLRKLNKWNARAKERACDMVDAVGVSPIEEIIFLFGAYARMPARHLSFSLTRLAFTDGDERYLPTAAALGLADSSASVLPQKDPYPKLPVDELSSLAVLRSAVLRRLGRHADARSELRVHVIDKPRGELTSVRYGEVWPGPMGRFEMAAGCWMRRLDDADSKGSLKDADGTMLNRELVEECSRWLDESSNWGSYELEARMGIKVRMGKETLKKLGVGST